MPALEADPVALSFIGPNPHAGAVIPVIAARLIVLKKYLRLLSRAIGDLFSLFIFIFSDLIFNFPHNLQGFFSNCSVLINTQIDGYGPFVLHTVFNVP